MKNWRRAYEFKNAFPDYDPLQPEKPAAVPQRWGVRATKHLLRNPAAIIAILIIGIPLPLQLFRNFMNSFPSVAVQIPAPNYSEPDASYALGQERVQHSEPHPNVQVAAHSEVEEVNSRTGPKIRWDSPLGELYQGIMGPVTCLKPKMHSLRRPGIPEGHFYLGLSGTCILSPAPAGDFVNISNEGQLYALPALAIEFDSFTTEISRSRVIPIGPVDDYSQIGSESTASMVRRRNDPRHAKLFYANLGHWGRIGQYNQAEQVRRGAELGPYHVYQSDIQGREYLGKMGPLPFDKDFEVFGMGKFIPYRSFEYPPVALYEDGDSPLTRTAKIVVCEVVDETSTQLRVYDPSTRQPIGDPYPLGKIEPDDFDNETSPIIRLGFSHDGRIIGALRPDGSLEMFRTQGLKHLYTVSDVSMKPYTRRVPNDLIMGPKLRMAFHPYRDLFLAYDDGDLAIIDLLEGRVVKRIQVPGDVRAYSWASGTSIVAASTTGQVFRWSASTYELEWQALLAGYGPWVVSSNFSRKGDKLTAVFSEDPFGRTDNLEHPTVRYLLIWDIEAPGKLAQMSDNRIRGHLKVAHRDLGLTYAGDFIAIHGFGGSASPLAVSLLSEGEVHVIPLSHIETGIEQVILLDSIVERPAEFHYTLYPRGMRPGAINSD